MKTIKLSFNEIYANVTPDLPHFKSVKGQVVELEDGLADVILNRKPEPGGVIYTPKKNEEIDTHVDHHPDALQMADDNTKAILVDACAKLKLDVTGNKPDLAKRLVDSGITQRMLIEGISGDES